MPTGYVPLMLDDYLCEWLSFLGAVCPKTGAVYMGQYTPWVQAAVKRRSRVNNKSTDPCGGVMVVATDGV